MGIIVEWPGKTTEYLDDIDPDDLDSLRPFNTTREWWPGENDGGKFVEYRVETNIERLNDGTVVVVKYAWNQNQENPDLRELNDDYWGKNRIIIEQGEDHGNYFWKAESGEEFESEWRKQNLREPRDHRRSHQQIRDAKFRPRILALDGQCVISGETTRAALDAAHIVPAAENGNEILENGIALRADIHRLYDAGKFVIHPETGIPEQIDPNLSEAYNKLLVGSALPHKTLERVRRALEDVWPE